MHQQPAPAGRSQRQGAEAEPRTAKDPGTTVTLGMSCQVKLQTTNDRDAVVQFQQSRGFGHQLKLQVQHRCSSSRLASRRWVVALAAAAEYRPCSAVSRDGVASLPGLQK